MLFILPHNNFSVWFQHHSPGWSVEAAHDHVRHRQSFCDTPDAGEETKTSIVFMNMSRLHERLSNSRTSTNNIRDDHFFAGLHRADSVCCLRGEKHTDTHTHTHVVCFELLFFYSHSIFKIFFSVVEKHRFISGLLSLPIYGIHLVWNTHTHTHRSVHLMCLMPLLFTGTHFHTFPAPGNTHSSVNVKNVIEWSQRPWCRSSPDAHRKAIRKCCRCCCTWPIWVYAPASFFHPALPTCKHASHWTKVWSSLA